MMQIKIITTPIDYIQDAVNDFIATLPPAQVLDIKINFNFRDFKAHATVFYLKGEKNAQAS